jgi:hypothetical protein
VLAAPLLSGGRKTSVVAKPPVETLLRSFFLGESAGLIIRSAARSM